MFLSALLFFSDNSRKV